jgi:hypothetical protein
VSWAIKVVFLFLVHTTTAQISKLYWYRAKQKVVASGI